MMEEVESILSASGYEYSEFSGCFDIIAKKEKAEMNVVLLKILGNIDSFQKSQSVNMKIVANYLNAFGFLVGNTTRRDALKDNVVYERFDIPAITPKTLENIMLREMKPFLCRFRGGMFVETDPERIRENRKRKNLSQGELAIRIGVTKKSVYEHEKKKMLSRHEIAEKMERIIGKVSVPLDFRMEFRKITTETGGFARAVSSDLEKLGLETSYVSQAPFNIAAKSGDMVVFSEAEERQKSIERRIPYLVRFSGVTKKPVIIVTKEESNLDAPYILEKELREFENVKELRRAIRKR